MSDNVADLLGYKENAHFYFGHSVDENVRFCASSGGVGTAFIKYLLNLPEFGTALTFRFNVDKCMYEPVLAYSFDEVNVCGSVYHDVDLIRFVSDNISKIKDGFIVSCMPCQVKAIRAILNRRGIKSFIISFACSGQTKIEGTWLFYNFLGIKKEQVVSMQYRGRGWPSGIQIELNNGQKVFRDNYAFPWSLMFESWLFKPKRCFYCSLVYSEYSDLTLADPWLPEYKKNEKIGITLFSVNTDFACGVLESLLVSNYVKAEKTNYRSFYEAQKAQLILKSKSKKLKKYYDFSMKINDRKLVRFLTTRSIFTMKVHNYIMRKLRVFFKLNTKTLLD